MLLATAVPASGRRMKALIVDGRNNHDWRTTSPVLKEILNATGLFSVEFATAPSVDADMDKYNPAFDSSDLIVLNYSDLGNGGSWSEPAKSTFVQAVRNGAGVVVYHAASSAFADWREYNRITGLGGWGGRDEGSGPRLYWQDGKVVRDDSPGQGGHHGPRHPFVVTARLPNHPILAGLPPTWTQGSDELYDSLRGPAENLEVLATAWSEPNFEGTDRYEPVLFTVRYGKGRIFHITLGHDPAAMSSREFVAVFERGAEWAATGRATVR